MCEREGKRGCCIVYVRKLSFMHEKHASPRLNIRHVNPAVSISFLFAISLTSVVFLATTDVAISELARVSKIGFILSEGLMNFHISLFLANAIVLIINKKGS
jgi:hypothetical protein